MTESRWVIGGTPEETIRLTIAALGMDVEEFAMRGLLPRSQFERVVAGAEPITFEIIAGMERVVGEEWPHLSEEDWDSLDDWDESDDDETDEWDDLDDDWDDPDDELDDLDDDWDE